MKRCMILLFLSILLAGGTFPKEKKRIAAGVKGVESPENAEFPGVAWAKHVLQGYNMRVWLSNQIAFGQEAWDPSYSNVSLVPPGGCGDVGIGLEYPLGSCVEHMYGGGPW